MFSQLVLGEEGSERKMLIVRYNSLEISTPFRPACVADVIIYTQKLLNSDWLRKECSSSVTRVQTCDTSANYKWFLIG